MTNDNAEYRGLVREAPSIDTILTSFKMDTLPVAEIGNELYAKAEEELLQEGYYSELQGAMMKLETVKNGYDAHDYSEPGAVLKGLFTSAGSISPWRYRELMEDGEPGSALFRYVMQKLPRGIQHEVMREQMIHTA